jgi:sugar (pentulose or hexulose) kinase
MSGDVTIARRILVIDIGKTNAKVAVVDTELMREIDYIARPNRPLPGPPYPHADTEGIWHFLLHGIRSLHARHRIEALVATTHAATAALLDAEGALVLPILDYEHPGPDELAPAYDATRPPFAETGSPRLPQGLNLGAQLFWLFRRFPEAAARTATILPYPQYWAFRLTGVAATEATSLGCHTDLWSPAARTFSSLVEAEGWRPLIPPVRAAADRLGPVTPEVAALTGLAPDTPVFCGIHDSNASLLPHLKSRPAPFAVVSTGTWVVSMAIGGRAPALDPARDTLINVSALGDPVPSARFMGGREWQLSIEGTPPAPTPAEIDAVLAREVCLLPAVEPGSGPFQGRRSRWTEARLAPGERAAAVSFYLALMTATCLELIGAEGPTVLEGPFAANAAYRRMLAGATGRPVLRNAAGSTGTSLGAALLALPAAPPLDLQADPPDPDSDRLAAYAAAWRARL